MSDREHEFPQDKDTRISEQLKDSVSELTFSDRMKSQVLNRISETDETPGARPVYRFAMGVAAAAALLVILNLSMLFVTTARTTSPDYAVSQLPGAAVSYNKEMQP